MTSVTYQYARRNCRAFVFALLLWIIVAMTALAISLAMSVRSDMHRVVNIRAALRADMIQRGAVEYIVQGLSDSDGSLPDEDDLPCQAIELGDGAFWVLRGDSDGDGEMDYGLRDEGGLLDLNTAPREILAALPDMTDSVACAIVDWRDSDDEITGSGAESDYYLRLRENPYNAKNSNFETTFELRLVAGVDDELFFGEDSNLNGILDDNEKDASASEPDDNRDGQLDSGLAALTSGFLSWETESGGAQSTSTQVDVNKASAAELRDLFAKYMTVVRATDLAATVASGPGQRNVKSVLQMYTDWGLTRQELAQLESDVTFSFTDNPMRLNFNAAPADVLSALGMLDEADVAALITAREGSDDGSLVWVLDAALSQEKLKSLASLALVGTSLQYSADVLAVSSDGRAFKRCKYVFDLSGGTAKLVYSRDTTALGWPLDMDILDRLRQGEDFDEVISDYQ